MQSLRKIPLFNARGVSRHLLRSVSSTAPAASSSGPTIIYTKTDEAPALATYSLLPIIKRFTDPAGIAVELADISVAARVLAHFPENLTAEQKVDDELARLGEICKTPEANVIKLPNISASIPQLKACIKELQGKGYNIPDYPDEPSNATEQDIQDRYAKVLGSAVNPVLREGNSDRRVAAPVKEYAQQNPHRMGDWNSSCGTHVASMTDGDFFSSEQSHITGSSPTTVRIELHGSDGSVTKLRKEDVELQAGEVIDSSRMSKRQLVDYFEREITDAADKGIMLSLHLKATMMKVSDPIMFGHAVKVYYKDVFEKHGETLQRIGVNPNNGIGDLYDRLASSDLDDATKQQIEADVQAVYDSPNRPSLAMVNSYKGITNLHVPSDVIIDASMPTVIRDSGCMWNTDDKLEETKVLIPDRSYAGMYGKVVEYCKEHGQFNVSTMGNVSNVGLMAQKAEEYGSHDKTFEIQQAGKVVVTDNTTNEVVFSHDVEEGDIWRMCQTKDAPIRDWVRLAVSRMEATGAKGIFWLNKDRAHDRNLISLVERYLQEDHADKLGSLDYAIMAPEDAVQESMVRATAGLDSISITGNVLRDYLTDLFPILELGTSAKMLSIVPLLAGGGLFETGAGGSAPKHVQQFEEENHLRWDSLGEYLAMAVALEELGKKSGNERATLLGQTLTKATGDLLNNRKSPSRKVNEIDNRGSNFFIAKYWSKAMAEHDSAFGPIATELEANEDAILQELIDCQGTPMDVGGYYQPNDDLASKAMRPSATFNNILDG
eukprot:g3293.t1